MPEELEQELLEHMQDSGMDVNAHRARLKAALQQSSRKTSAIEFQADFQQALSGWRKGHPAHCRRSPGDSG